MPIHPAILPTHRFAAELVEASARLEDGVPGGLQRGDVITLYDDLRSGVVEAIDDGVAAVSMHDGQRMSVPADDDALYFLEDRPSLAQAWERHLRQHPAEGVAMRDDLAAELRERLLAGLQGLERGRVDYHPGSGTIVRDLVHPSLYPLVRPPEPEPEPEPEPRGEPEPMPRGGWLARLFTRRAPASVPTAVKPPAEPDAAGHDRWGRAFEASIYQWLPTRFTIDEAGSVRIAGAINNLDRQAHGPLYHSLEHLFAHMLPLFESVYGYAEGLSVYDEDLEGEHELPDGGCEPRGLAHAQPRSLRGSTVQVITKIVQYRLDEGERFEGVWHVEGMSHEHILATGVCTVSRDPGLEGGELRFKRAWTQDEAGAVFWNISQTRPTSIEDLIAEGYVPLGSMPTRQGECFVFPNSHVHKLTTMTSAGGPATRRVIVFWLVDPEHEIPGTEDVEPPQASMSFEQACEVRLALMEERRLHKQSMNVRAVSLCEH